MQTREPQNTVGADFAGSPRGDVRIIDHSPRRISQSFFDHGAGQREGDIEDAERAAGAVETICRRYAGARYEESGIVARADELFRWARRPVAGRSVGRPHAAKAEAAETGPKVREPRASRGSR